MAGLLEESQRLQQELREERDRLRLLLDVNNLLVSRLDYPELLRTLSESMQRVVKHDSASVALSIGSTGQLRLQALTYTAGPGVVEPDITLTLDGSAAGITFRTGIARVFRKDDLDRFFKDGPPLLPPSLQSLCCVPLVTRRGTLGTLNVASLDPDAFPAQEVELLKQISDPGRDCDGKRAGVSGNHGPQRPSRRGKRVPGGRDSSGPRFRRHHRRELVAQRRAAGRRNRCADRRHRI